MKNRFALDGEKGKSPVPDEMKRMYASPLRFIGCTVTREKRR